MSARIWNHEAAESRPIESIAIVGNHLPRHCGIATFTTDLHLALSERYADVDCFVVALNDLGRKHAYPECVRLQIEEGVLDSYRCAADALEAAAPDVVSLQHEYGIFGGRGGAHVVTLLRELSMPVVTTLHTVLTTPNQEQRTAMDAILEHSSRVVVMSRHGAETLTAVHGLSPARIDVVPHGVPALPDVATSRSKLDLEEKLVLLTFGLLSPDKGIEYVLDALPAILKQHPNCVYIVAGATHPHVKDRHGEDYRRMLKQRALKLGVEAHVVFHDRFLERTELMEFVAAADVYITPYLNMDQSTSGTLAYALGSGKAVISTPYQYAREQLDDGRGLLVEPRNGAAIARAVRHVIEDDDARASMWQRASDHGRSMLWPTVAEKYMDSFERAREKNDRRLTAVTDTTVPTNGAATKLPTPKLDHLVLMTDDTGLLQHASYDVPRYEDGYCLDDNARALAVLTLVDAEGACPSRVVRKLQTRYLAFVRHAWNPTTGRFRNFMAYTREWTESQGSEDSHGRALWALGTIVGRSQDAGRTDLASELFLAALPAVAGFSSPRAWAFALLGIDEYLFAHPCDALVLAQQESLSEFLFQLHERTATDEWPWFEDRLTYCNARLAHALLVAADRIGRRDMTAAALRSLEWLTALQTAPDGNFRPVGAQDVWVRGGPRPDFDQQPVEAGAMVSASLAAYCLTGDRDWSQRARWAFDWFMGKNDNRSSLYDDSTGGCRDGLHEERTNENQGAESTLAFLLSLMELRALVPTVSIVPAPVAQRNGATVASAAFNGRTSNRPTLLKREDGLS